MISRLQLLSSDCSGCYGCSKAVVQNPESGRWFITMGHVNFNSRANNRDGYATKQAAEKAISSLVKSLIRK